MVKFKTENLELVKEIGSLSVDIFKNNLIKWINENLTDIDKSFEKKIDRSLLRYICNIVENSVDVKNVVDKKIDKKQIVLDIYILLKPQANTEHDKQILSDLVEDLHNIGEIKKVSTKRYIKKNLSKSLKKLVSWL